MAVMTLHADQAIGKTITLRIADADGFTSSLTLPNFKAGAVVGAFSLPRMTGTQYVGDSVTVDNGDVTSVTATRVYMDDVLQVGLGSTFLVPDPNDTDDRSVHTFHVEIDGTVNGSATTVTTPKKVIYSHEMVIYGDDTAAESMARMTAHMNGDRSHQKLMPHESADIIAKNSGDYTDPNTWDLGRVPAAGENVLVQVGTDLNFDAATTPDLGSFRVDGTFTVDSAANTDRQLRCKEFLGLRGCNINVGTPAAPIPETSSFEIVFLTGALDVATDNDLMGRGYVCTGNANINGYDYDPFVLTRAEAGARPLTGDTSLKFDAAPRGWAAGMKMRITGTVYALNNDGSTVDSHEDRVISGFSGTDVLFDAPLIRDHDERYDDTKYGARPASFDEPQIPIALLHRNVRFVSSDESAPIKHRPHAMHMHSYGSANYRFIEFRGFGRTDKQEHAGRTLSDGTFETYTINSSGLPENSTPTPTVADDNVIGRYGLHFHRCKPKDANGDNEFVVAAGNLVNGTPGWGIADHSSFCAIAANVVTDVSGAGIIAEEGNETGYWAGNFVTNIKRRADNDPQYLPPKSSESGRGRSGDRATRGIAYFMAGRDLKMAGNFCGPSMLAYTWHHRYGDGFLSPRTNLLREEMSFQRMDLISEFVKTMKNTNVPLDNVIDNVAWGCWSWGGVVKAGGSQNSDIYTRITGAKAYACYRGILLNYVGSYLISRAQMLSTHYRAGPNNPEFPGTVRFSADNEGGSTTRSESVFWADCLVSGFDVGLLLEGGNLAQGRNNAFTKARPRFGVFDDTGITSNGVDVDLQTQNVDGQPQVPQTDAVTLITASMPTQVPVEIDGPFIIADFILQGRSIQNIQTVTKRSSIHSIAEAGAANTSFPYDEADKTWDLKGWPKANDGLTLIDLLTAQGYYTVGADNVLLLDGMVHADEAYGNVMIDTRAIRLVGDVSGYTDNGTFALTTTAPTRADITDTGSANTDKVIDILTAAVDGENGAAQIDLQNWRQPEHGELYLDGPAGEVTYRPNPGFVGEDHFSVIIKDDGNGSDTVEVYLTIT